MGFNENNSTFNAKFAETHVIPQKYIKVQSDWNETNPEAPSYIHNKPDLSAINEIPKKLSDLEDDTITYPVAISYSSFIADRADCDGNGKYIPNTYATKAENDKKLDREWQLLGEDEITQADITIAEDKGDVGVSCLVVICGELGGYTELKAQMDIPKDDTLNKADCNWRVGLTESLYVLDANGEPVLDDNKKPILNLPNTEDKELLQVSGYAEWKLKYNFINRYVLTSIFIDGYLVSTEVMKDNYGRYKAYMGGGIASMNYNGSSVTKIEGKKVYWFIPQNGAFYFPKGTKIKVFGR